MNLFLDTNVYLGFYKLSGDDLEELKKLTIAVRDGGTKLLLTQQTRDEFERNREKSIADSLDFLQKAKLPQSFPRLIQSYPEYEELRNGLRRYETLRDSLLVSARQEASTRSLHADLLIKDLWDQVTALERTDEAITAARSRVRLGNPPGKDGSLGDAVNWEILLTAVPDGEDLLVVSADSDFRSPLADGRLHGFLEDEWTEAKGSSIALYPSLSALFKDHYPTIRLASELERELAVAKLTGSDSFSSTHAAIADLGAHSDFTDSQVQAIADAAKSNSQIHWILGDRDVRQFYDALLEQRRAALSEESAAALDEQLRLASASAEDGSASTPQDLGW